MSLVADAGALAQAAVFNAVGQPVGCEPDRWSGAAWPPSLVLQGRFCRLEALDAARHGRDLFICLHADASRANWTYLNQGPFASLDAWQSWLASAIQAQRTCYYALIDVDSGMAQGMAAYMNAQPEDGCVEIGGVHFSPAMRRSRLSTEAMYLMLKQVFELNYRRGEWRCDAHNASSARAALRLGFTFECLWRQRRVSKGRNRDAACFSMLDHEWPARRLALESWLHPMNFDAAGRQRCDLAHFMARQG